MKDIIAYGTGTMLDNKHVPHEETLADTITVNRIDWEHLVKEHKSLKEWVDKAFVAHPNLDLDVEAVEKGNI
jgi:hypothetical protein